MQLRKLKKIKLLRLAHEELGMESGRHGAVWRLSLHRLLGASHRPQAEAEERNHPFNNSGLLCTERLRDRRGD
jgi:hypothetical protein